MRFQHLFTAASLAACLVVSCHSLPARAVEIEFERDPSLPLVHINVALKAGSAHDPGGQSGITNFMGEMLLRGTKLRTKEQIDLTLDQMGASLEVETRAEAMIMRGAVLSSQLGPFLQLVAEILTQPSFPDTEMRKLKAEINSSILEELGRDPTLAGRWYNRLLFRNHPYGKPILGSVKDIDRLTREKVILQYNHLLKDKYLLVVGAGDAPAEQIKTWAESIGKVRAASLEARNSPDVEKVSRPEDPAFRRLIIIDKPDRSQTQINLGQIGVRMTEPNYFPLYLGNYAFGGSFSSRLMSEIRVKTGWSYGANSYFRMGLQPRLWQVHLFPQDKVTPQALAKTLAMVQELKDQGISKDEFDFAQGSLVNSSGFMYNTSKKRVENKLLERTLDLPDGLMKSYGAEIAKLSLDQVNSALREYLRPERLTIAVLGTAKSLKEPLAKAAGVAVGKVEVVPYTQE